MGTMGAQCGKNSENYNIFYITNQQNNDWVRVLNLNTLFDKFKRFSRRFYGRFVMEQRALNQLFLL